MTEEDPTPPPDPGAILRRQIESSSTMLSTVCDVLHKLLDEVRAGEVPALKQLNASHAELARTLRQATETERTYHDWLARHADDAPGAGIDFDLIRAEIRGQLDRLRTEIGSREVPDGDT